MGELFAVLFRGLIFVFLFLMVRSLWRTFLGGIRSAANPESSSKQPPIAAAGELKKDPVCGTYVSAAASITGKVNGQTIYFCSPECRDRYQER